MTRECVSVLPLSRVADRTLSTSVRRAEQCVDLLVFVILLQIKQLLTDLAHHTLGKCRLVVGFHWVGVTMSGQSRATAGQSTSSA